MYSELIYTRCGEGIDILKGKMPVRNSGFKVFSCSDNITEDGIVDLNFLHATAQSKEPYSDPSFMDDAYLFFVPDIGERFLLNFHPIPFDREATGDYSHRPGNFINQVFVGSFADLYPYETFDNQVVWDAQARGEAYYYENTPTPLPLREDLGETIGSICIDDIASFVIDGRREVLKKAIGFLITQYSRSPEDRKFLVIKDVDSRNIELWIAAIESAFSPLMASGLSFATRLDKFTNANKYTVNLTGQYQTQINLQSPNQKPRLRAMIVGVDERDRTNISAAKPLANSPFVLLDGNAKTLSIELDTSDSYYQDITAFDERHVDFCREFLQSINVTEPSGDVLCLHTAYAQLTDYFANKQLKKLLGALAVLEKYQIINTPYLRNLYSTIKEDLPNILRNDAVSAFTVINWLEHCATIVGDDQAKDEFTEKVCNTYANNVFMHPQSTRTTELHNAIKKGPFASVASATLTAKETVNSYQENWETFESADWESFAKLFSDCIRQGSMKFPESVHIVLSQSIRPLYQSKDYQTAKTISACFAARNTSETIAILLNEAQLVVDEDPKYTDFLIWLVCMIAPEEISDERHVEAFCNKLQALGLENYYCVILSQRAKALKLPREMEQFLNWMCSKKTFDDTEWAPVVRALDKNLSLSDKNAIPVALKIQDYKPGNIPCINSAHLCVLKLLDEKNFDEKLLHNYEVQGFPSVEDKIYADVLLNKLFNPKAPQNAVYFIAYAASRSAYYAPLIVSKAMTYIGSKQSYMIGDVVDGAGKSASQLYFDAFVKECSGLKQFDKGMASIKETIQTQEGMGFFASVEKQARVQHEQRKEPSLFGRLFSRKQ